MCINDSEAAMAFRQDIPAYDIPADILISFKKAFSPLDKEAQEGAKPGRCLICGEEMPKATLNKCSRRPGPSRFRLSGGAGPRFSRFQPPARQRGAVQGPGGASRAVPVGPFRRPRPPGTPPACRRGRSRAGWRWPAAPRSSRRSWLCRGTWPWSSRRCA